MGGTQRRSRRSKRTANPPKTSEKQSASVEKAKEPTMDTPHDGNSGNNSTSIQTTQTTPAPPPSVSQDSCTSSQQNPEESVASSAASTATHRRHSEPLLHQQRHRRRKKTTQAATSWEELPSAKVLSASFVKKYSSHVRLFTL